MRDRKSQEPALGPVEGDTRFVLGIAQFQAGDFDQASDQFEELFFDAVRDEVDFVRVFLQISAGVFHAQCGQRRPAIERLEEGLRAMERVTNDRGFDLPDLHRQVVRLIGQITASEAQLRPTLARKGESAG